MPTVHELLVHKRYLAIRGCTHNTRVSLQCRSADCCEMRARRRDYVGNPLSGIGFVSVLVGNDRDGAWHAAWQAAFCYRRIIIREKSMGPAVVTAVRWIADTQPYGAIGIIECYLCHPTLRAGRPRQLCLWLSLPSRLWVIHAATRSKRDKEGKRNSEKTTSPFPLCPIRWRLLFKTTTYLLSTDIQTGR